MSLQVVDYRRFQVSIQGGQDYLFHNFWLYVR